MGLSLNINTAGPFLDFTSPVRVAAASSTHAFTPPRCSPGSQVRSRAPSPSAPKPRAGLTASPAAASPELLAQFGDLVATDAHFGLVVTIEGESLAPLSLLTPSRGSFAANLDAHVAPVLRPDRALFLILRRHAAAPHLAAVTYVPDAAPVRQKMLFASTRLSLVRELGGEHFREALLATSAAELSGGGFAA